MSIRDLSTILEGIQESCAAGARAIQAIQAHVRIRLSRQISIANTGPSGYIPALPLSAEWEAAFADAIVVQGEERQLAITPSKLREFVQALKTAIEATGEHPVVICSSLIRPHVRMVVERSQPATVVLAQQEIHPKARIRALGSI